jgi:hypothetical protein
MQLHLVSTVTNLLTLTTTQYDQFKVGQRQRKGHAEDTDVCHELNTSHNTQKIKAAKHTINNMHTRTPHLHERRKNRAANPQPFNGGITNRDSHGHPPNTNFAMEDQIQKTMLPRMIRVKTKKEHNNITPKKNSVKYKLG